VLRWFTIKHGPRVRARIHSRPRKRIVDLGDETRECVGGEVEAPPDLIFSPLTQRPCVYWLVTIDEVGVAFDFVQHGSVDQGVSFVINDDSGRARVIPDGARVDLPSRSILRPNGSTLSAHERVLFNEAKVRLNWPGATSIRFNEHVIEVGAKILVFGNNQREPVPEVGSDAPYRANSGTRPVLASAKRHPLLITDDRG
jgi:hypothetical protein